MKIEAMYRFYFDNELCKRFNKSVALLYDDYKNITLTTRIMLHIHAEKRVIYRFACIFSERLYKRLLNLYIEPQYTRKILG